MIIERVVYYFLALYERRFINLEWYVRDKLRKIRRRIERTISLVDNDSSGKPKISREEGTDRERQEGYGKSRGWVPVSHYYQLHYYLQWLVWGKGTILFATFTSCPVFHHRFTIFKEDIKETKKYCN